MECWHSDRDNLVLKRNGNVISAEAVVRRFSIKKVFLEILLNSQETPVPEPCNFIKKETMAQVFFCEFCEISKNTFSCRTTLGACFRDFRF